MIEIVTIRRGLALYPVDDMAAEEIARIPEGREVLGKWRQPRNPRQHRLAWALAQKLADCCDWLFDREDAMEMLKIKARHVRWITDPRTGEVWPRTKSISFHALDQTKFDRIFNRFIYVICTDIVPGLDSEALRREVLEMTDGDLGRRARQHDARYGRAA